MNRKRRTRQEKETKRARTRAVEGLRELRKCYGGFAPLPERAKLALKAKTSRKLAYRDRVIAKLKPVLGRLNYDDAPTTLEPLSWSLGLVAGCCRVLLSDLRTYQLIDTSEAGSSAQNRIAATALGLDFETGILGDLYQGCCGAVWGLHDLQTHLAYRGQAALAKRAVTQTTSEMNMLCRSVLRGISELGAGNTRACPQLQLDLLSILVLLSELYQAG